MNNFNTQTQVRHLVIWDGMHENEGPVEGKEGLVVTSVFVRPDVGGRPGQENQRKWNTPVSGEWESGYGHE